MSQACRGEAPPVLPTCLSSEERAACLNLVYCALKLTLGSRRALALAAENYREALKEAAKSEALQNFFNASVGEDDDGNSTSKTLDRHGNIAGQEGDLGREGAFAGYTVLIGNFVGAGASMGRPTRALQEKGFTVVEVFTEREFIHQLKTCDVAAFISGSTPDRDKLTGSMEYYPAYKGATKQEFIDACVEARANGLGIWVWADNDPLFEQANAVLPEWFGFKLQGNTPGSKVLQLEHDRLETGQFLQHTITNGILKLYEGVTISHPPHKGADSYEDMDVLAVSSDGWPVSLYRDNVSLDDPQGRVLVDCGFTKLYCSWDDAGTARYVVNGFVWLLGLEHKELQRAILGGPALAPRADSKCKSQKLASDQLRELGAAVDRVIACSPALVAFPLAVAIWLRNKRELGNRLISTTLLTLCMRKQGTRPYCRHAAQLVLKLPSDLAEVMQEYDRLHTECLEASDADETERDEVAKMNQEKAESIRRPACLKKIARDFIDGLQPYQAAKYDTSRKMKRTKQLLSEQKQKLACLSKPQTNATDPVPSKVRRNQASNETVRRQVEGRIKDLQEKLEQQRAGNLQELIRHTHAQGNPKLMMEILGKRYPEDAESFKESRLPGDFDPTKAGMRMRVETPMTWDRQLSQNGNVPKTWALLLSNKDSRGRYTLPYMALLRNIRNVLLMGLPHSLLRTHVLSRLPDQRQIQGSGQTATSISHTWSVLEKEFNEDRLQEIGMQADVALRDVLMFRSMLKRLCRPVLGFDDKQIGIIGEFLGEPLWQSCGLRKKGDCFLTRNTVTLRDNRDPSLGEQPRKAKGKGRGKGGKGSNQGGAAKNEKWLPVALHPLTSAFLAELKQAFDKAIEVASSCRVQEGVVLQEPGDFILWLDLSKPPLALAGDHAKDVPVGLAFDPKATTTTPGQELELDEITTRRCLCFELRYISTGHVDLNVVALSSNGAHLWSSTTSNPQITNKIGSCCVVRCSDGANQIGADEPVLRAVYLDLEALDDEVSALMISAQSNSSVFPSCASLVLREYEQGSLADLKGKQESHDRTGQLLLWTDLTECLALGGTATHSCLFKDPSSGIWLFRDTLDMSLMSKSRNASQIQDAVGGMFKNLLRSRALASTIDTNQTSYVRMCQLYQAVAMTTSKKQSCPDSDSKNPITRVFVSGVKRGEQVHSVVEITRNLTGCHLEDLEAIKDASKVFTPKVSDVDEVLNLVLEKAAATTAIQTGPAAMIRVAGNSLTPSRMLETARAAAGRSFLYGSIDTQGHIFDTFETLPTLERCVHLPGQVESCVSILQNALSCASDNSEPLIRYVSSFLPSAPRTTIDEQEA